ncbi:SIS domain-containing protein [Nocardioides coralli]|uniref:SIS domain-containing protein n=1 Tax=Nocardioides coralli TaxID=2872154 RepID=UPI001CA3ED03|nr:SIS domain-containing protein [Nocardioides coralli]QZY30022.1 hypothetical protein K6T13_04875 [Nocardioides coralli]
MATWFDESRLDDEAAWQRHDATLRLLAESGARVRREVVEATEAISDGVTRAAGQQRPRAVVAAGPDSRLLRAVLEPWCPVPFVAWPAPSLPGWAGGLDLVVVLAHDGGAGSASAVAEAVRRGCQVVVACPPGSMVAEHAAGRWSTILPSSTRDQLATAVVMLEYLEQVQLGPRTDSEGVATALDEVATACSPHRDLAGNPAKELAISMADSVPMVWGGSVLAARAARRIAESLRRTSGRSALAGDAEHLLPVLEAARQHDVFDDPFAGDARDLGPMLLVLDDGNEEALVREERGRLRAAAGSRGVRVETLTTEAPTEIARYASLLLQGRYAAEYLGLGLTEE